MTKFITGNELGEAVYNIIWDAKETLVIVSPYIKLDDYFKKLFDKHANNPKINLVIVFGKNQKDIKKSMSKDDFDYFKKFLNVSVVYVPNLHAKYYGNETKGVTTSINLYDYSFKNNIEFGVYSEYNLLDNFTNSVDKTAWQTCMDLAHNNEVVFIKRPVFEKKLLSSLLGKNYVKSDILHDTTDRFYSGEFIYRLAGKTTVISDFPDEIELGAVSSVRPTRDEVMKKSSDSKFNSGYCIRTGKLIPFNPKKPYSEDAYKSWSRYGNPFYQEKYCHKTGKKSDGKTCMSNPIL